MFKFVHIGWVSDSDGDLRCYPADCNLFPMAEECGGNNNDDVMMVMMVMMMMMKMMM